MSRADFNTVTDALKQCYLPVMDNQIGITPSAFMAEIEKVNLEGGKEIETTATIGLSGGFGFGSEGSGNAPEAGSQMYAPFKAAIKDMYTSIEISDKAIKLSKSNAFVNAFDAEVKGAYATAEWNVGRALFGDGSGKLCNVTAQDTAVVSVKVDSLAKLKEGLVVDFYTVDGDTITKTAAKKRIKTIDRTAGVDGKYTITIDSAHTAALGAGFITCQNSYNNELTGLGLVMSETGSLYGLTKSANPFLKPVTYTCGDDESINDSIIDLQLRIADREKSSRVNMLLCSDSAYAAYSDYLRSINQRVEANKTLAGGFRAISYDFGATNVSIVNEGFIPEGEIWGVDTKAFKFHKSPWDFVAKDGSAFERMSGSSNLQALLACYGNLICSNPGGCVRIKNCA